VNPDQVAPSLARASSKAQPDANRRSAEVDSPSVERLQDARRIQETVDASVSAADAAYLARLRLSIANGTFVVDPTMLADRLIEDSQDELP
jgi:anti-sigma28 factor (negative regulator of flagellin synthesis)